MNSSYTFRLKITKKKITANLTLVRLARVSNKIRITALSPSTQVTQRAFASLMNKA